MIQLADTHSRQKRDSNTSSPKLRHNPLASFYKRLIAKLKHARQASRERHSLSCLSEHQLRDIGLTRGEMDTDSVRIFCDISAARCSFGELLQGGLTDNRRARITRLPRD